MTFATALELQQAKQLLGAQKAIAVREVELANAYTKIAELSGYRARQAQQEMQALDAALKALPGEWVAPKVEAPPNLDRKRG